MGTENRALKKNVKGRYRVFFVYSRGQEAALLDRAIKASGLSATAFFVKAGKLLARVQGRADEVGFIEAAKALATLER